MERSPALLLSAGSGAEGVSAPEGPGGAGVAGGTCPVEEGFLINRHNDLGRGEPRQVLSHTLSRAFLYPSRQSPGKVTAPGGLKKHLTAPAAEGTPGPFFSLHAPILAPLCSASRRGRALVSRRHVSGASSLCRCSADSEGARDMGTGKGGRGREGSPPQGAGGRRWVPGPALPPLDDTRGSGPSEAASFEGCKANSALQSL